LCPGYTSTGGGGDDDDDDDDECESPTANAGPDQSEEVCPQTNASINLVGSGTGTPTLSYSWDFDASNGITVDSTEQSPSGVPFAVGTYTVTLTVTNACGSATDEMIVTITESEAVSAYAGEDQSYVICPPDTSEYVSFIGSGTGTGTLSYSWNFDDGDPIEDSIEQNPENVPFGVGVYNVVLTVKDECGTATDEMTVTITEYPLPTANAGPDQCIQLGCESEVIVDFDGSGSSGVCLNYDWDFDDGNYGTGSNPSHTYPAGTYDVTLTVTDICGRSDTDTMVLTIHSSCGNSPDQLTVSYSSPWTTNHYLKVKFSDGGGDILPDFQYYGWCSHLYEQGLPISGDVMYAYCTLELDKYWDKINYIINNRDGYGKMAVQWAIWHYIHNIDPDSSSSTVNSKAWELIDDADANGIGFCPGLGEKYVVLLTFFEIDTYGNLYKCHHEQTIMIEVDLVDHCLLQDI
jgi:PKD repeat protein